MTLTNNIQTWLNSRDEIIELLEGYDKLKDIVDNYVSSIRKENPYDRNWSWYGIYRIEHYGDDKIRAIGELAFCGESADEEFIIDIDDLINFVE